MVSSLVVTVLLEAVGASFAPFTVKVIVEDVVVVPSETVKVNTSVPLYIYIYIGVSIGLIGNIRITTIAV